jgi:hypothetical protein
VDIQFEAMLRRGIDVSEESAASISSFEDGNS